MTTPQAACPRCHTTEADDVHLPDGAHVAKYGRRMRELRKERGLSQEELAHRAGLHYTYIGGIERGERNPALVNISRISTALEVSPAEFFSVLRGRPRR